MSQTLISPLFLSPKIFPNYISNPNYLPSISKTHKNIICSTSKNPRKPPKIISDAQLSSEFAAQVLKLNTQIEEKQMAISKSKRMLFDDFSHFLGIGYDEVKIRWMRLNPDEKLGLVNGFVSQWGLNFHPLSTKSIRDLIDEFVVNDLREIKESSDNDDDYVLGFSRLKKLFMGD
ncbi:hypothetical protein vseg_018500 [Gypsophila vaccaria]